jgi:hypothetical protein
VRGRVFAEWVWIFSRASRHANDSASKSCQLKAADFGSCAWLRAAPVSWSIKSYLSNLFRRRLRSRAGQQQHAPHRHVHVLGEVERVERGQGPANGSETEAHDDRSRLLPAVLGLAPKISGEDDDDDDDDVALHPSQSRLTPASNGHVTARCPALGPPNRPGTSRCIYSQWLDPAHDYDYHCYHHYHACDYLC